MMRSGQLSMEGSIDPFKEQPAHIKTQFAKLHINELNDFLRAYVNVDVEKGNLSVYADIDARSRKFKGYVKPLIEGLDILEWKKEDERPIRKLWEGLVGATAAIFNHRAKDRLATCIPLEGRLDSADLHAWDAIVESCATRSCKRFGTVSTSRMSIGVRNVGHARCMTFTEHEEQRYDRHDIQAPIFHADSISPIDASGARGRHQEGADRDVQGASVACQRELSAQQARERE